MAAIHDDRLRDSYLALASEYEKLAELLDPLDRPTAETEPPGRFIKLLKIVSQVVRTLLRDRRGSTRRGQGRRACAL